MTDSPDPDLQRYRFANEDGPADPLSEDLDTPERWRARARLVRPDALPAGQVAEGDQWIAVYHRKATVPIESDADLDATSAYPRSSGVPGVYDYLPGKADPDAGAGG